MFKEKPKKKTGCYVYVPKKRSEGGHHTEKKKLEVAAHFLATGNWSLTAKLTEVPLQTIVYWRKQPWWNELLVELQTQEKVQTSKKLTKARDLALDVVMDRLEHGNHQYDPKTGQIKRIPVGARDAHRIASDFLEKEDLLQARIAELQKTEEASTKDVLTNLARSFEEFAKSQVRKEKEKVIEVEVDGRDIKDIV